MMTVSLRIIALGAIVFLASCRGDEQPEASTYPSRNKLRPLEISASTDTHSTSVNDRLDELKPLVLE